MRIVGFPRSQERQRLIGSWRHRNTLKTEYRDVAKFGIALALGARDFAGSNPVIPTINPSGIRRGFLLQEWLYASKTQE